jgi:hypothetical protein
MSRQFFGEQGFLTIAINTADTDYLRLAYLQALNIKATQSIKNCAVIVDQETYKLVTDQHRRVFDHIIPTNRVEGQGPFATEWHAWWLSPWKETIKVESDLLFTRDIGHWVNAFRLTDVCLSYGCRNYKQELSPVRKYRQLFDANKLPDVYNGLMYWRYSETSKKFFDLAKQVFENWSEIKKQLKNCEDDYASTDVAYALVSNIMDVPCYIPSMEFINFVHMKPGIQEWSDDQPWTDYCVHGTRLDNMIHVNNINQLQPFHYYEKSYATDDLIADYERRIIPEV